MMMVATRSAEDEPQGAGHRAKRFKAESAVPRHSTFGLNSPNPKATNQPSQQMIGQTLSSDISQKAKQDTPEVRVVEPSQQHRPLRSKQNLRPSRATKSRSTSTSVQDLPISVTEGTPLAPLQSTNKEINVSSAPADPSQLAIWIAQAIRHIHHEECASTESDNGHHGKEPRSLSHLPELIERQNHNDGGTPALSKFDKKRDEQRDRKRRWRSEHTEESRTILRFLFRVSADNKF